MRILLISPLPGIDPACGDVTYTQTLLEHPPTGVEYETYTSALMRGALREHGTRNGLRDAVRLRQRLVREVALLGTSRLVNAARQRKLLFWEPFRFFSVRPGEYDAVHVHVFSVRFMELDCPVVLSTAAPLRSLYLDARGYSHRRVAFMERCELALSRGLSVDSTSYRLRSTDRVIAITEFLKNWYVSRGIVPASKVDVIPVYLPSQAPALTTPVAGRVGFVAKDFFAKGGPTLLKAWDLVRTERPDAQLWIAGGPACARPGDDAAGIRWLPYMPREELLNEVMPSFSVFAYPTQFDGMPLTVLEALALGTPVATSDYQAMPEIVPEGVAGLVSAVGDARGLANSILALLEPSMNAQFRTTARAHFESTFSAAAVRPQLAQAYKAAVARSPHPLAHQECLV